MVGGLQANAHHPSDVRMIDQNVTINDNLIHDVAIDYRDMVAILVTYASGAVVSHNEVYNMPYTGIAMGYGWGVNDVGGSPDYVSRGLYNYQPVYAIPTTAKNNQIVANYIHDVMQQMNDGGCLYHLSASPGTVYSQNYCANNHNYFGIYNDEGSRYLSESNNVFENTGRWSTDNATATNHTGDLSLIGNWTTNPTGIANGTRGNVVTGTMIVTNGAFPPGARQVIAAAGLEPAYQSLKLGP